MPTQMGISSLPPCPPDSGPLSPCKLMHLSLVRSGIYTPWAQHNVIPAQYYRDPKRIDEYLAGNDFLRDINNERVGDEQASEEEREGAVRDWRGEVEGRNATYKDNLASLDKLVLFRFRCVTHSLAISSQSLHAAHAAYARCEQR